MVKNSPANAGDTGNSDSIPGSGRSLGEGNDDPLQCSCLENPIDRGVWWVTVRGVTKSRARLSTHACMCEVQRALWEGVSKASISFLHTFRGVSLYHLSC